MYSHPEELQMGRKGRGTNTHPRNEETHTRSGQRGEARGSFDPFDQVETEGDGCRGRRLHRWAPHLSSWPGIPENVPARPPLPPPQSTHLHCHRPSSPQAQERSERSWVCEGEG